MLNMQKSTRGSGRPHLDIEASTVPAVITRTATEHRGLVSDGGWEHGGRGHLVIRWALILICLVGSPAAAQTYRSTRYTGTASAWIRYAHRSEFDATVPMTVEAWVYR